MKRIELFENESANTPIVSMANDIHNNHYYMKRDDLIPFSFGGNKVRKAFEYYKDIVNENADVIMTYGSSSSNHCRIIANMAVAMEIPCHIISPIENKKESYNTDLITKLKADIETCPVDKVSQTIMQRKNSFLEQGKRPYFIYGGGHGNPGTEAYVKAYHEIQEYERITNTKFDYIFHASGTGTTQAGLVCGKILSGDNRKSIVGISIAREEKYGREIIKDSIREYLKELFYEKYQEEELIFTDEYRCGGYGLYNEHIERIIEEVMLQYGIPMDTTYVGKAYYGMKCYIEKNHIKNKNILFIHTGGTPLFFDWLAGK